MTTRMHYIITLSRSPPPPPPPHLSLSLVHDLNDYFSTWALTGLFASLSTHIYWMIKSAHARKDCILSLKAFYFFFFLNRQYTVYRNTRSFQRTLASIVHFSFGISHELNSGYFQRKRATTSYFPPDLIGPTENCTKFSAHAPRCGSFAPFPSFSLAWRKCLTITFLTCHSCQWHSRIRTAGLLCDFLVSWQLPSTSVCDSEIASLCRFLL